MPSADGHRSFKSLSSRRLRPKGVCVVAHSDAKNGTQSSFPAAKRRRIQPTAQARVLKWELTKPRTGRKKSSDKKLRRGSSARIKRRCWRRLVKPSPTSFFVAQTQSLQVFMIQRDVMIQRRRVSFADDCIRHMDCRQRRETCLRTFLGVMVVGHSMNQWERETPDAHQVGSHLGMRATEKITFWIRTLLGWSRGDLQVILRQFRQQNDLSKVVQQSRGKAFLQHCL